MNTPGTAPAIPADPRTLREMRIDARADRCLAEIRLMASSARRSIGQRARYSMERLRAIVEGGR